MIGEALTTRRKSTLNLRLEFLWAGLDRIDTGTRQGQDETSAIQPRNLRTLSLIDLAAAVPMDRCGKPQFARKLLGRRRGRHNFRWQLDCDRGQREPSPQGYSNQKLFSGGTTLSYSFGCVVFRGFKHTLVVPAPTRKGYGCGTLN
jgi:hypothetical protein